MNRAQRLPLALRVAFPLALIIGASGLSAALPEGGAAAAWRGVALLSAEVLPITACSVINRRKIIFTRTSIGIQGAINTKNRRAGDWAVSLLDPMYRLPSNYKPTRLTAITWLGEINPKGGYLLKREAAEALSAMFAEAKLSNISLRIVSAYRSYAKQVAMFAALVAKSGVQAARKYTAVPGHSEHQLGTAVDLGSIGGGSWSSASFPKSATALWLDENAYRFGFVRSYPSGSANVALSCYGAEAWHWRFVGTTLAYEIVCSEQVPRIFLWNRQEGGDRLIGPACDLLTPPEGYGLEPGTDVPSDAPTEAPTETPPAPAP